ncbi:MAG: RdgB/HAM1 family non-canonical purine NTP pyrophosphatase [Candidatus Omnitrophota bacterium]|jgi:XTP/dITP diphosphohydrolase
MPKLLLATTNQKKLAELRTLIAGLGLDVICLADLPSHEEVPETGHTFAENASLKAAGYARQAGLLTLADDSGLCCDALNGEPGVYSARFSGPDKDDHANNLKILELLEAVSDERRGAHFTSAVALAGPDQLIGVVEGHVHGMISREILGDGGFGYDPLFFYPPYGKTFGQVPADLKHKISHRAVALEKAKQLLTAYLKTLD